jgi:hypothetical protein
VKVLAAQMVATHFAAMGILRRLKGSETIPQQDSNGNLAVKLLRTKIICGVDRHADGGEDIEVVGL